MTASLLGSALYRSEGQKKADSPSPASLAHFESKVRPVFLASCVSCHGKESAQAGLRLDVAVSMEKARAVLMRVRGEGGKPKMPPGKELPKDKIAALEE